MKQNQKRLLSSVLVTMMIFTVFLSFVTVVHAVSPTINATKASATIATACPLAGCSFSVGSLTVSSTGDLLTVAFNLDNVHSSTCFTVVSVTDAPQGLTWVSDANSGCIVTASQSVVLAVYHAIAGSTTTLTSITITVGSTDSAGNLYGDVVAFDVTGAQSTSTSGTSNGIMPGSCAGGCNKQLASSLSYSAPAFLVATFGMEGWSTSAFTAGTGLTLKAGVSSHECQFSSGEGCVEYGIDSSVTSPTFFPFTVTGGDSGSQYWTELAVIYQSTNTVTVTTVVPPPITAIQYWFIPILYLGMYDALFFTQGILARVSTKGLIYLMLGGFVLGSIVGLLMGFIGIQLVILSLISLVVWFWRFR